MFLRVFLSVACGERLGGNKAFGTEPTRRFVQYAKPWQIERVYRAAKIRLNHLRSYGLLVSLDADRVLT